MTQECKCELDGFQGAIWKGDCPLHKDDNLKTTTNNNFIRNDLLSRFRKQLKEHKAKYDNA